MLRAYSAVHGLNSPHHAVVEVGADEILLRVDTRWTRFTHQAQQSSEGAESAFALNEDGTVTLGSTTDEMDMTAERVAAKLLGR